MGCASTKSSHVTTTVAPVVEVCQGIQENENNNVVNGLEPPPVIIEGERPPNLIEDTVATMTKGTRPADVADSFCRPGNEMSLRDEITTTMKEVQLVAPAPDINGSTVSVTLTPDDVDESALKELLEERTPVKVVVKQSTDWMKQVTTTTTAEEFQRIAESTSDNPSEILHMTSFEPNRPSSSSSSSSSSADELEEMTMDHKLEMDNNKIEKAG